MKLGAPLMGIKGLSWFAGGILATTLVLPASADDSAPIPVTLKDHKFAPAEIHVKANAPSQILLTNADSTAEEFDSSALHVEKVVAGGDKGIVRLRPLAPGRYPFMGEYHSDTAQGVVIAE
jgi:hypothetical protein